MERFEQIELKINGILDKYQKIKAEKDKLQDMLAEKDLQIKSLGEQLEKLKAEKNEARSRVDNLLMKLEEITLDEIVSG